MSPPPASDWDRHYERVVAWAPYALLVVGTILVAADQPAWTQRAQTLALSAVAAAWLLGAFTRAGPSLREDQRRVRLYFAGLVLLAAVAMAYDPLYFVFAITGLLHAYLLRPWKAMLVGLAAASLVLNSALASFSDPTPGSLAVYLIVVTIQTGAIGIGLVGSDKLAELSEQRRRTVAELEAALEENARLQAQLVGRAREAGAHEERQRLAEELHDTLAQGLTGVIMQLQAAQRATADPPALRRHIDSAARLARDSLGEARRSVHALHPAPLDTADLPAALADVASRWSALHGGPVEVTTTDPPRPLHPEIEATLLRVAQEALANVAKHADASRVGVTLSYLGNLVTLDVRDDGSGFAPDSGPNGAGPSGGYGLTAMRQRVERLGGHLDIESAPGTGTAISVRIPAGVREVPDGR